MREGHTLAWQRGREGEAFQAQQPVDARTLRRTLGRALQVNEDEAVMEETGEAGPWMPASQIGTDAQGIRRTNGTHRERQ